MSTVERGYTVEDVARRYRVSPDKVRGWIRRGELRAINTASVQCGRPRFVVSPEALSDFERRRAAGPGPEEQRPRRKRRSAKMVDYYAD